MAFQKQTSESIAEMVVFSSPVRKIARVVAGIGLLLAGLRPLQGEAY